MKRIRIDLESIAHRKNLVLALHKAARGKRFRRDIAAFLRYVDGHLNQMSKDILAGQMPYGRFREFYIFDPKKRLIHAACFEDRVFHHAVMNLAGPVLERAMSPTSFACRPGMGVHRAVERVQENLRSYPWYAKIDIKGYFAAIDHELVYKNLLRRFKGKQFESQLCRILDCYEIEPGKGLPIGSLTSQYFANYFLDGFDRFLDHDKEVRANVRYMDDIVWWCNSRQETAQVLLAVRDYLHNRLSLKIKPNIQIQRSVQGITYCGFRISQGTIRLSRRRKRSYQKRRHYWEQLYQSGIIDSTQLQKAYSAVHSITAGTESREWRRENLRRHPPPVV